ISVVQQFFNNTLIATNGFNSGHVKWARKTDSTNDLAASNANLQIKLPPANTATIALQFYIGPSDYNILKKQAPEMDRIINLGRDL
ncbi:YidC/Oxa1 family insertase periplasmic-domain containing protein, partial [Klebsiella pneumoniae]|uniref:YidC/Oxa1 family insertase periplasmic-domain containing protein n=1 Tax=Klebsiella pneumoniae TaxID=573 RepID=UPI003854A9F4